MEEDQLWRRLLVNNLVEAGMRFAILARLFGGLVGPVFLSLSAERARFAGLVLEEHPDEALERELGRTGGTSTGDEVVEEETSVAFEAGEAGAAEEALARERALLGLVEDLSHGELAEPLRASLLDELRRGTEALNFAAERTRARDSLTRFSTKSVEAAKRSAPQRVYDVWFGTNRLPVLEGGVVVGFSGETADATTFGRCAVAIPRTHKIGENRPALWRRIVLGERPLSLQSVARIAPDDFWAEIRARVAGQGVRPDDAIVFLHGYNVSFEEAAIRAAQIGADLNLPGPMAFFSWPSQGRARAYSVDEATIEASEERITEFLEAFVSRSGAGRVHLVAHSMGNRGLLRAVNRIAGRVTQGSGRCFGQIVLAAPDVDRRTFAMLAKAYPLLAERTTLYISDKDLAVRSSRFVHAAARVGYEPPVTIEPGVDTVSVSRVDLSFLGHGYVAGCRAVLTDIHQLIVSGSEPRQRAGMTSVDGTEGRYWELAA